MTYFDLQNEAEIEGINTMFHANGIGEDMKIEDKLCYIWRLYKGSEASLQKMSKLCKQQSEEMAEVFF